VSHKGGFGLERSTKFINCFTRYLSMFMRQISDESPIAFLEIGSDLAIVVGERRTRRNENNNNNLYHDVIGLKVYDKETGWVSNPENEVLLSSIQSPSSSAEPRKPITKILHQA
jgi:hypothetical protein